MFQDSQPFSPLQPTQQPKTGHVIYHSIPCSCDHPGPHSVYHPNGYLLKIDGKNLSPLNRTSRIGLKQQYGGNCPRNISLNPI